MWKQLEEVPSKPLSWYAVHQGKTEVIVARLWYEARALATVIFGCSISEVNVSTTDERGHDENLLEDRTSHD